MLAERWAAIAGQELQRDDQGRTVLPLNNASIRFVEESDGRGDGLGGIDVKVEDKAALLAAAEARGVMVDETQVLIGGVRINLVL